MGTEIRGPCPILVVSEDWYNERADQVIGIPLTRFFDKSGKPKPFYAWEVRVRVGNQEGKIMTDQIHSLDKERLGDKMADLPAELLEKVMINLKKLMIFRDKIKAKL